MIARRKRPKVVELRNVAVMVRVNAEEYDRFTRHADKLGLTLSAWVRMILRQEVERSK